MAEAMNASKPHGVVFWDTPRFPCPTRFYPPCARNYDTPPLQASLASCSLSV